MTSLILQNILTLAEQLHAEGNLEQARKLYQQALQISPLLSRTAYNLGILLNQQQDYCGAADAFTHCLTTEPTLLEARLNLAFALQEQGKISEALTRYQSILNTDPDCIEARFNLACLHLLQGNLTDGLNGYELRFSTNDPVTSRHQTIPVWSGDMQAGLRLLIHAEQGYGDTILMLRYLPLLISKGLEIILEVPTPLYTLCCGIKEIRCIQRGTPVPEVDCRLPVMSLPRIMGTTLATIPAATSYLTPDPELVRAWRLRLPDTTGLRVGLAWAGRYDLPVNRKRSCPPALLLPLLAIEQVSFISLQLSPPDGFQLNDPRLFDCSSDLTDFNQTAALIANLDLVITIDTAVAHLAGALGIPTWLMLPTVPDWRWLLDREDSPWYPSMQIFRQPAPGDWQTVIINLQRELARQSSSPAVALTNLGVELDGAGNHAVALECYREAISCDAGMAVAHYNCGNTLSTLGRHDEACTAWQQALALDPAIVEAWHNLAIKHRDCGDLTRAFELIRHALYLRPNDPDLHHTIGELYQAGEQYGKAVEAFKLSLELRPNEARTWNSLGILLQILEDDHGAEDCYRQALEQDPLHLHASNNLGAVLLARGLPREAALILQLLLEKAPDYHDARWNLACALLAAGEWEQGWEAFEYRFHKNSPVVEPHPELPRWAGEPLAGKTLLLVGEQAFGDTIQFVRFASLLADQGARVILECQAVPIVTLMAGAAGVAEVYHTGEQLPPVDYCIPLMSLPYLLKIPHESIGCSIPYLGPDPQRLIKWRQLLDEDGSRLRVGLCWWGRQTLRNRRRSCPPELLVPLSEVKGSTLYRLAVGDDVPMPPFKLIDHTDMIEDFADTAAFIGCLDLVITIDTAVAHLAGALGKPVWLMLPQTGDWRWLLDREDSPWYPTMRIFRQSECNNWKPVITEIVKALEELLQNNSTILPDADVDDLLLHGDLCREQEQWLDAFRYYRQAAEFSPVNYRAHLGAGGCQMFLNRHEEAALWFRRAIALDQNQPDAHINLGLALLCSGVTPEAWQEFDWRCQLIEQQLPPILPLPKITPGSRLDNLTLLVHAEQGYGDLIQFARYLPIAAETGVKIIITVPQAMVRLISTVRGVDLVIPHGELLPDADYQIPLLSLPGRLSEWKQGIPETPYLSTDPDLKAFWRSKVMSDEKFKIGLVWRGSDLRQSGYRRSLTAELLAPLNGIPDVACYSLQIGTSSEELALFPDILDLTPQITDFADTAAIMANLDLVISVDTAVAHLAGALGTRCWMPLLYAPDWRWHPLREHASRWYSSITTFRQTVPGSWEPVIEELALALRGEALLHKGHQLGMAGKRKLAIETFRLAASLPEQNGPALLNLGIYLRADGQIHEAKDALVRATKADPAYPEAWQNLGLVHQDLGELPEAYTCLKRALILRPEYATARWNLGLLQLLLGEYGAGFRNCESRFDKIVPVPRLHTEIMAWDGSSLAGKTILVHAEQGYGDTIQFVRFLPLVAKAGGVVILEVQDKSLLSLCHTLQGVTEVVVRGEPVPTINCQAALLSLPYLLGSTLCSIPCKVPYLSADIEKVSQWNARIPRDGRHTIGICWKGRPTPDPHRSIPFDQLAALFELPGICWVSLQTEQDQAAHLPDGMIDLSNEIRDFSDTAAIMGCLDMVISIDSAVAHLAGALGVPGMVLLPFAPDWRWTIDQEISPWYQSLHLLRQHKPGQWGQVLSSFFAKIKDGTTNRPFRVANKRQRCNIMNIQLITMWFNEEFIAPFFLNHYSWVDTIHIILDSDTDDKTEYISRQYPNVQIHHFRFPDMMDDIIKSAVISHHYNSINEADYVIIVDSDEFVFPFDLSTTVRKHLEQTLRDIYFVNLWQIYKHEDDLPLDPSLPVYLQRRHGDPDMESPENIGYLKPIVVRGGLNIFWGIGNHYVVCQDIKLEWNSRHLAQKLPLTVAVGRHDMLQGAHWCLVDLDETIKRRIYNRRDRQSSVNLKRGLTAHHHLITKEKIVAEYERHKHDPSVI
jgi:tetratricopeptide (TPR) repeat protein